MKATENVKPPIFGLPSWGPSTWFQHLQENKWNGRESFKHGINDVKNINLNKIDVALKNKYECKAMLYNLAEEHKRIVDCCRRASIDENHPERKQFELFVRGLLLPKYFVYQSYEAAAQIVIDAYKTMTPKTKALFEKFAGLKSFRKANLKHISEKDMKTIYFLHLRDIFVTYRSEGLEPVQAYRAAVLRLRDYKPKIIQKILAECLQKSRYYEKGYKFLATECFLRPNGQPIPRLKEYIVCSKGKVAERRGESLETHVQKAANVNLYTFFMKENCRKRMLELKCSGIEAIPMLAAEYRAMTPEDKEKLAKRAIHAPFQSGYSTFEKIHAFNTYVRENYASTAKALNTTDEFTIMIELRKNFARLSNEEKAKLMDAQAPAVTGYHEEIYGDESDMPYEAILNKILFRSSTRARKLKKRVGRKSDTSE